MSISRELVICSVSLALLFTACAPGPSPNDASKSAVPSTTLTHFEQQFSSEVGGRAARIGVSDEKTSKGFRPDNIGISFESTKLADARLDPVTANLGDLLNSLGSPALGFRGNELDRRLLWTSSGESLRTSEQVAVTPHDLKRLKKLVDVTGSTVTLGIPLGTYDAKRGADTAAHAVDILGDSLVGLSIGNEPNGYAVKDVPNGNVRGKGWNKEKYVQQLEAYAEASHKRQPDAPIIGPDVYDGAWMEAFADSNVKKMTAISQHWYQLYECDSKNFPAAERRPRTSSTR